MSNVKIKKEAQTIIGITCRTSNQQNALTQDIPKLWEKFYQEGIFSKIPHKAAQEVIALYCEYEADETSTYSIVIGCPVHSIKEIPEGMVMKIIPASTFIVIPVEGEFPTKLINTWKDIWQNKWPRTYTGDYELYQEDFPHSKKLKVFIAVKDE